MSSAAAFISSDGLNLTRTTPRNSDFDLNNGPLADEPLPAVAKVIHDVDVSTLPERA